LKKSVTIKEISDVVNGQLIGDKNLIVEDITHDSKQVSNGWLFVAIKGMTTDGNAFISQALQSGAIGVISENEKPDGIETTWIRVEDARAALARSAALIQGYPTQKLKLVGITGTNGKTTTAYLVNALAEAADEKCAMLTTVESRIGKEKEKSERTTPETSDAQRFFRKAVDAGCSVAVMECSSIAMDLRRCDELDISVAVFSNLTRDHLDYHKTMENYFDAKLRLFDGRLGSVPKSSVVNLDDEYGLKLAEMRGAKGQRVVTYALNKDADVRASEVEVKLTGTSFLLSTPIGNRKLKSPLVGVPHVYNILSAVAAAIELGFEFENIIQGVEKCTGAPGRFEPVPHDGDFAVVVDYAHTDDALVNVLKTARNVSKNNVITVFGCGGDRDRTKRAPMGEAAALYSDFVILTSDNPRAEDPLQILDDVEVGLKKHATPYLKIADRRAAINHAIAAAKTGDVVMIAGKGHEDYQIIGKEKFHFDDREVASEALRSLELRLQA
jgi:UDP-N-acetylmuramyl-tripeptide synthetase